MLTGWRFKFNLSSFASHESPPVCKQCRHSQLWQALMLTDQRNYDWASHKSRPSGDVKNVHCALIIDYGWTQLSLFQPEILIVRCTLLPACWYESFNVSRDHFHSLDVRDSKRLIEHTRLILRDRTIEVCKENTLQRPLVKIWDEIAKLTISTCSFCSLRKWLSKIGFVGFL